MKRTDDARYQLGRRHERKAIVEWLATIPREHWDHGDVALVEHIARLVTEGDHVPLVTSGADGGGRRAEVIAGGDTKRRQLQT